MIGQIFSSSRPVSIALDNLAALAGVSGSVINNSSDLFIDADLTITLAGTVGAVGIVDIYLERSEDGSTFPTTSREYIGGIILDDVNTVIAAFRVHDLPKYWRLYAYNNDTVAVLAASGNSVSYTGVKVG